MKEKESGKIDLEEQLRVLKGVELRLGHFKRLSEKVESGGFDAFVPNPKGKGERKEINKNNRNLIGLMLTEWYKLMFEYMAKNESEDWQLKNVSRLGEMVALIKSFESKESRLLEEENIKHFLTLMKTKCRTKLKTSAVELKQDFSKNYYNSNLTDNLHTIIETLEKISRYPLFERGLVESLVFPFVVSVLKRQPTKEKEELLTFAAASKAINVGKITIPHFLKMKSLLSCDDRMEDVLRDVINK